MNIESLPNDVKIRIGKFAYGFIEERHEAGEPRKFRIGADEYRWQMKTFCVNIWVPGYRSERGYDHWEYDDCYEEGQENIADDWCDELRARGYTVKCSPWAGDMWH